MTARRSTTPRQPLRWKWVLRHMALTALVSASSRISELFSVEAKSRPYLAAAARSSSLPAVAILRQTNAPLSSELPPKSSPPGRSSGLVFIPSFLLLRKRISAVGPDYLNKDTNFEWTISTRHANAIAKIRGGSLSDSEDESEEYDSDEDVLSDGEYENEEYDITDSDSDAEEYDSDEEDEEEAVTESSLKSSILSKSQVPSSEETTEYDDMITPPAMQQFAISIGVMMLSNRIDILNAKTVRIARFAFVAYLVSIQLFLIYVRIRVKSMDDRTPITISNPLASLVQNGAMGDTAANAGGNFVVKALADQMLSTQTTVLEYDLKQVKKMNGGLLFPMMFLYFLHFKMKQVQPLLMQTATGFLNLVYCPLFQVYVLGRNLERPFKPPANPMMEALQGQMENGVEGDEVEAEEGHNEVLDGKEEGHEADEEEEEEKEGDEDHSTEKAEYDDSDEEY